MILSQEEKDLAVEVEAVKRQEIRNWHMSIWLINVR